MSEQIIQVDAFTSKPFHGNPAAVCVLSGSKSDLWMQLVAREMNLSETAFLLPEKDGFNLRWFTPTTEVPLCGHATLASAYVLWTEGYLDIDRSANFYTLSGLLTAVKNDEWITLNFPANISNTINTPPELINALGLSEVLNTVRNSLGYLVEVRSPEILINLQPNFSLLKKLATPDVIVTSRGNENYKYDFVSRFFAPGLGINEDPVTGAAHCCLAPYWRDILHKNEFLAYQASDRGGILKVSYEGSSRVFLSGQAVTVMKGELLF